MKKVGVKDIAKQAGVSTGTVDRVLNNRGRVSDKTKKNVLEIASKMGYKPNLFAKTLSSKRNIKIAICLPSAHSDNPYWEKAKKGINKAIEDFTNYNVELKYIAFDASSLHSFDRTLDKAIEWNADGVVFSPVFTECSLCKIEILNKRKIPFVFVDINIQGVGSLAYYGQEAIKSGKVAGVLMQRSLPAESEVLIVKMAMRQVFSAHINARVQGFIDSFRGNKNKISIVDVDLNEENEPEKTLSGILTNTEKHKGVFVPNSRGFKVGRYIEKYRINDLIVVGYDMLDQNVKCLENGSITYLINQKPEEQVYGAIIALFNLLVLNDNISEKTFSPIDIVIKENVEYYK